MLRQRLIPAAALVAAVAGPVLAIRGASVAVALLPVAFAAFLLVARMAVRARRALGDARRRAEQLEMLLGSRRITPARPMPAIGTERREPVVGVSPDSRPPSEAVESILRMVRDQLGADEAIYFQFTRERDALAAVAWASEGATAPRGFRNEWHRLVEWTAREQVAQCDASDGPVSFAAAPVGGERAPLGCICIHRNGALPHPRESLLRWLPRYAGLVKDMVQLLDARQRLADASRRAEEVLHEVEKFPTKRTPADLGELICRTALKGSGGDEAVLVVWHREKEKSVDWGEVVHATDPAIAPVGLRVERHSLVGEACHGGLPYVLERARPTIDVQSIFGPAEPKNRIGALGIYPLLHKGETVGAIAVISHRVGGLDYHAMRQFRLLSLGAAVSLESVWEFDTVRRDASTDQLTGLRNRRAFDEQLEHEQALVDRGQAQMVSLVVADIDHFKKVNDTYGHEAGDAVLKAVAKVFMDTARETDLCARFGGEEIAVLAPGTSMEGALELAERLRRAVAERPVRHGGHEIPVTASFGVATYPDSARSREAFFPAADKALYDAKRDGRNRVKCAPQAAGRKTT